MSATSATPETASPVVTLRALVEDAKRNLGDTTRVTRLLVGVGGCSSAVGAREVLAALRDEVARSRLAERLIVVEVGCSGRCWNAVEVALQRPDGSIRRWGRVFSEQARELIDVAMAPSHDDKATELDAEHDHVHEHERVLLERVGRIDPALLDEAIAGGAYAALAQALSDGPEATVAEVERAGLAGRGGAYFPVARKWSSCRASPSRRRYLVVNAEEGEPGVYKDRHLLEGDPHLVLEGALIAAHAIAAERVIVYVNGEAHLARERLALAIEQAGQRGLLGASILGSGFGCEIELREGAGGYVLGEESTLLESVEGARPMPRIRPPFPTEAGLFGQPTVIQNVETLANLPAIVARGAGWFAGRGAERWKGTKLIAVSGAVRRPGLVEVELGTTLRAVIEELAGGVLPGRQIQAILTGGPSGNLIPPSWLDRHLEPRLSDILLGSGNLVVLDETVSLLDVVRRLTRFNAESSCGKCTPCREGVRRMHEILERVAAGEARPTDRDDLTELCDVAAAASICGLGQMAGNPIRSALAHFSLPGLSSASEEANGGD